jgi:hypothetical protein
VFLCPLQTLSVLCPVVSAARRIRYKQPKLVNVSPIIRGGGGAIADHRWPVDRSFRTTCLKIKIFLCSFVSL